MKTHSESTAPIPKTTTRISRILQGPANSQDLGNPIRSVVAEKHRNSFTCSDDYLEFG